METAIIKLCADARAKRDRKHTTSGYLYFSAKIPAEWHGNEKFVEVAMTELGKTYHFVAYYMGDEFILSYRLRV